MSYSRILAMFPGQGSQYVGMARELLAEFPESKTTFEEAEDAAHIGVRRLCLEGPEDDLKLTANTQPCLLTVSVAAYRILHTEAGLSPSYVAGHSLGEYSALVAAGRLKFAQAVELVRCRGEAMQSAVPEGLGAMAAVIDVPADELTTRCSALSRPGRVVEVANYNSPQQIVISGHRPAVEELVKQLEGAGRRSVILPVSAPFHSSLMAPARDALAPRLNATPFVDGVPVIANLSGKVEAAYGASFLIDQMVSPVRWTQTLNTAVELECQRFIEVGPNKVLFGLARRTLPKGTAILQTDAVRKALTDLAAWR